MYGRNWPNADDHDIDFQGIKDESHRSFSFGLLRDTGGYSIVDGSYYKVIGLSIDALEAEIIQDKNVKDIDDVLGVVNHTEETENIVWVILPCRYKIE